MDSRCRLGRGGREGRRGEERGGESLLVVLGDGLPLPWFITRCFFYGRCRGKVDLDGLGWAGLDRNGLDWAGWAWTWAWAWGIDIDCHR